MAGENISQVFRLKNTDEILSLKKYSKMNWWVKSRKWFVQL